MLSGCRSSSKNRAVFAGEPVTWEDSEMFPSYKYYPDVLERTIDSDREEP